MANMKESSVEELKHRIEILDREIFALNNELALSRKLDKPHELRAKRREKARCLTFLTQKHKRGVGV